jgi:K+-transporting ATPase ATPase C chain
MRRQLAPAMRIFAVLTILLGVAYPLVATGLAQGLFPAKANGSLLRDRSGAVVGSRLIGQSFTGAADFQPRPSAAGDGFDASASGGSNLGPSNPELAALVRQRVAKYRRENHLAPSSAVPVDAVTASASGLDPEISIANARLQAPRVAAARHLPLHEVLHLISTSTEGRTWGFLGGPGVNVLELNLALDRLS